MKGKMKRIVGGLMCIGPYAALLAAVLVGGGWNAVLVFVLAAAAGVGLFALGYTSVVGFGWMRGKS